MPQIAKEVYVSLGMRLPVVNVVLLYFLGFSDWPVLTELKASRNSPYVCLLWAVRESGGIGLRP
jgi:hypothetical protein